MSRLIDRLIAEGARSLRPSDLGDRAELPLEFYEQQLLQSGTTEMTPEQLRDLMRRPDVRRRTEPTSTERFDTSTLQDVPVIAGDDVGRFCAQYVGQDMADVVTTLAPPFDRLWIDFQGVPNGSGFHSWGVLVEDITESVGGAWSREEIGWHLWLTLVIEPSKGEPVGPVAHYLMPLSREGLWDRDADGKPTFTGMLARFEPEPPPEVATETLGGLTGFVFPALMTLSFMHCKNVTAREVTPPTGLNKKWRRKTSSDLVRYHVLDIAPMGRVLAEEGHAGANGLASALHICRGHFKTFSEAAPLFGRVTGTFWWAPHVRGDVMSGEIVKDYRVRVEHDGVGEAYREANEDVQSAPPEQRGGDPDASGRGYSAHNRTQNRLADAVRHAGLTAMSPRKDDPPFDLAFRTGDGQLVVCEVKSLTEKNEERQLRGAVGQVVRYRHQLRSGDALPQALIAVERQPVDPSWLDTCNESGVILAWPETFALALAALQARN